MKLEPLEPWFKNGAGRQDARNFADNQSNRQLIAACLLDYAMQVSRDPNGHYLIRGATDFVQKLLTVGEVMYLPSPPKFGLPIEGRYEPSTEESNANTAS